MLELTYSHYN